MAIRGLLTACLVFSGLSALVYQVLWTRLLGFAFGTTTEAIGTVLAVFFGGMALGNWLAARRLDAVKRPLRLYGLLELGIGCFALVSLPLLRHLDALYSVVGVDHSPAAMLAIRTTVSALILLPPTVAMGATLPVVARGLVAENASLGRWSAYLYSANTFGAVAGAYLCGFWMIPGLGLTSTVLIAAAVNLAVAAAVWHWAGHVGVATGPETDDASKAHASADAAAEGRRWFLAFFGLSGFVAIGYEIVWSKVFTIVMEGTLYGFSTVLSAYLLGLALGSIAISGLVDRIRDLPRAFGLLHAGIALSVAVGLVFVADLPHWHHRIAQVFEGGSGIHGLYFLAAPIVLLPTMLFGAAFPVLIRLYTARANEVGEGMGIATAVNTAGSIAASLLIGFWAIPIAGIDATLYALVLIELSVALVVLLRFQTSQGARRVLASAGTGFILVAIALSYNGVHVEQAVMGRWIEAEDLASYREQLAQNVELNQLVIEGRTSVVTVNTQPGGWKLMTNGMPEAGYNYAPPHRSLATLLLGMLPYLTADSPERALVVGFGGGATLDALRRTSLEHIDVVELEKRVLEAASLLYQGRPNPLRDPRVELHINDGRNHLLLGRHRGGGGYDVIASQPSHPWLAGAANLFTEEYFVLARENLNPGGTFGLWVNGFHAEPESLLALFTSFHRIFPDSILVSGGGRNHYSSFILLGAREPHGWRLDLLSQRMAEPDILDAFEDHGIESVNDVLARFEGPLAGFAAIAPEASNTDDNAFVEMRLSRAMTWESLDYAALEERLADDAPVLPEFESEPDVVAVARSMQRGQQLTGSGSYGPKLLRLLRVHGDALDPFEREILRAESQLRRAGAGAEEQGAARRHLLKLAESEPSRPEPWRAMARHRAQNLREFAEAGRLFGEAWQRSGSPQDAYDAARAWHWVDPGVAWDWAERIPLELRADYPRMAVFEAVRFLASEPDPSAHEAAATLARHYERVHAYLDTEEGSYLAGVHGVLSRLAAARGDEPLALAHRDADSQERTRRAAPHLARAATALATNHLEEAGEELAKAAALMPNDTRVLRLEAKLAVAEGDSERLSTALWMARRWSPSLREGVGTENALRAELRLPQLPERPPGKLSREDSRVELPR